jgi:hypothetical protein
MPNTAHPHDLPQPRLANANRVTQFLMVGGSLRSSAVDPATVLRELRTHGLTHILDCRSEHSDEALVATYAPEVFYHRTSSDNDAGQWFESGVGFARQALAQPGAVLLTHCSLGQTRGPSMGFAVLIDQGHDPGDALRLITTARPMAGVGYAEAALRWHLDRTGATQRERTAAAQSLENARRERFSRRRSGWR